MIIHIIYVATLSGIKIKRCLFEVWFEFWQNPRLVSNFDAIFIACGGPVKRASKIEIFLDFVKIQILSKTESLIAFNWCGQNGSVSPNSKCLQEFWSHDLLTWLWKKHNVLLLRHEKLCQRLLIFFFSFFNDYWGHKPAIIRVSTYALPDFLPFHPLKLVQD